MNPDSQHYKPEQWADFVRKTALPADTVRMQAHLDSGCMECKKTLHWLKAVTATAAAVPTWEPPPDEVLARAKSIFRAPQPAAHWMDQLETMVAQLVLVSSNEWATHGVRSGGASRGERRLYRAGDYSIDVALDPAPVSFERGEIIGQIINDQQGGISRMKGVLVQLYGGNKVIGETETNEFGEFVIQRPGRKASSLRFGLPIEGRKIEVILESAKERSGE